MTAEGGSQAVKEGTTREFLAAFELGHGQSAVQARRTAKPVGRRRQAGGRDHVDAGDQDGFGRIRLGHHDFAEPRLDRGGHGGEHAAHRANVPSRPSSPKITPSTAALGTGLPP